MAEGEGFEPPLPFRVKRFSRPPVSTAHTSLRMTGVNSLAVAESYVFFSMRREPGSSDHHVFAEMEGWFSERYGCLRRKASRPSAVRGASASVTRRSWGDCRRRTSRS